MEHGPAGPAWAAWLEHSAVGHALRNSVWLFPAVETLHIVGFALLVGAIVTFDARVVAARSDFPLRAWARAVLPVARVGFALALPMGLLLLATETTAYARNPAFRLKLVAIGLALVNVGIFHRLAQPGVITPALRLTASLSLGLWLLVLICGRMIAYL